MLRVSELMVIVSIVGVNGVNIMLNKPSVQSSTYSNCFSSYANDGIKANTVTSLSLTSSEDDPYWQGDLLGFYTVTSVSVTSLVSPAGQYLNRAFIGVSLHDVNCRDGEVIECGQWPDVDINGQTLTFNCSHAGPVRFVKIWRPVTADHLGIAEVEVEGEPTPLTGTVYDKLMSMKITGSITPLSVADITSCGTMCHKTQPCLGFSYSKFETPNCLLATNITMTTVMDWVSYSVNTCFKAPGCQTRDLFS